MKTKELIERVKSAVAAWHAQTKGKDYQKVSLRDFWPEIRRLEDAVKRVEAGGPTPDRTPYSAESVERHGDKELTERHESFGLVGFSRVQGSTHLFGSHLERHHHFIVLRVHRAQVVHSSLGYDRHRTDGRVPIVEVEMSAAQFAEAITTMNVGEGVPCTIRSVEGCPMEPVPEAVVTENVKIRDGFAEKVKGTVIKATNARDAFAALVESGATVSKGRARELLGILDKVVMDLRDNAPFHGRAISGVGRKGRQPGEGGDRSVRHPRGHCGRVGAARRAARAGRAGGTAFPAPAQHRSGRVRGLRRMRPGGLRGLHGGWAMKPTFEVDKEGLAKLLARRGIEFAVLELVQNALDENVTRVTVQLVASNTRGYYHLTVEDDNPEGFADLRDAYTLFAESRKKANPEQRGRFNLGEKLVIAVARTSSITTTKGTVRFDREGRHHSPKTTKTGTIVEVAIRMTHEEADSTERAVRSVLVPDGVALTFNGDPINSRAPLSTFSATLATEQADQEGYLRATRRQTTVRVMSVLHGETATLYELGIPVVPIDCVWHVDIAQKVPLNTDRDNVTPAYLRTVRALVLNAMHDQLPKERAGDAWVADAMETDLLSTEAVKSVITDRYGDKVVIRDPSDPEGTKLAVSQGYAVIEPRSFSSAAWDSIRRAEAAKPAGQVTPSNSEVRWSSDPDAKDVTVPEEKWTAGVRRHVELAGRLARRLLGGPVTVSIVSDAMRPYGACFGGWHLSYNVGRLGWAYFDKEPAREEHLELIVHELGHHFSSDHLDARYHDGLCTLAARLARLVEREPGVLREPKGCRCNEVRRAVGEHKPGCPEGKTT